jgi:ribosomal protein S18 acetylase RimI-like enzyme
MTDDLWGFDESRIKNCFYTKLGGMNIAIADIVPYMRGYIITRINVPSQYRGQGYGRELLLQILEEADKHDLPLYLEVSPSGGLDYLDLVAWYTRHGFRQKMGIMVRPRASKKLRGTHAPTT